MDFSSLLRQAADSYESSIDSYKERLEKAENDLKNSEIEKSEISAKLAKALEKTEKCEKEHQTLFNDLFHLKEVQQSLSQTNLELEDKLNFETKRAEHFQNENAILQSKLDAISIIVNNNLTHQGVFVPRPTFKEDLDR